MTFDKLQRFCDPMKSTIFGDTGFNLETIFMLTHYGVFSENTLQILRVRSANLTGKCQIENLHCTPSIRCDIYISILEKVDFQSVDFANDGLSNDDNIVGDRSR